MDEALHAWFQSQRHPVVTPLMLAVTHLHSTWGLLVLTALFGLFLWRRGQVDWLLPLLAAVPGAMLLNVGLKHVVQRTRPVVDEPILALTTYSFPSGHAAGAAALYTFLAAWWLSRPLPRRARAAVFAGAASMMAWVDVSRVYLGVHYATDVAAGSVVGVLWVLACLAVLRRRRS